MAIVKVQCIYCESYFRTHDDSRDTCDECEGEANDYAGSEYESEDDSMFKDWKDSQE